MVRTLARDPIVLVALAIVGGLGLTYFLPNLPDATRLGLGDRMEIGPLLCLIIGCWYGLGQLDERNERRFWGFLGLAFVFLLLSPLTQALVPEAQWNLLWEVATDVFNLAFYLFVLVAIEVRPHYARTGSFSERERHLRSAGVTLVSFFGLAYFIVTFVMYELDSYHTGLPSLVLYVLLDVVVLARLIWTRRATRCARWTVLYGWLAVAMMVAMLVDVAEAMQGVNLLPSGTALDLVWALPPVVFLLGVRTRHARFWPDGRALDEETFSRSSWRAGHVLMILAFALPVVHYLLPGSGLVTRNDRRLPELVALGSMITLGALALVAYRILERDRARMADQERQLMTDLAVARKMDAVARLAGSVAHDFNNLIQVVRGRAEFIAQQINPSDPVTEDLHEICAATTRASNLASQLMTFGRRQPAALSTVSLHEVVAHTQPLLAPLFDKTVQFRLHLKAQCDVVRLDPMQFERVLINLAINARDAMPSGGTLTLTTSNPSHDVIGGADRGRVLLTVSDTGSGMDQETMSHIFEPFFSTKDKPGAGLGLAIVHSLVQQCGGSVSVESAPGAGSVFKVSLPALEVAASPIPSRSAAAVPDGLGAVLIVDGEPANRQLLRRLLSDLGRPILATATAAEAIQIASRYGAPIDLAVIDISIEDGRSLADHLRETQSGLRALLLAQDQPLAHDDRDVLLREPFGLSEVLLAADSLAN